MECSNCKCGEKKVLEEKPKEEDDEKEPSWSEFTQEVSMHGIRYVHLNKIHPVTKVLWVVTILIMLLYAGYASWEFFNTFIKRETTTKFRNVRVKELQFPNILVCSNNAFNRHYVASAVYSYNVTGLDILLKNLFAYGQSVTHVNWSSPEYHLLANLDSSTLQDAMYKLSPPVTTTIQYATFRSENLNITTEFKPVLTDIGLCYSFNEDGRHKVRNPGLLGGLLLVLNAEVDSYYVGPESLSSGFSMAANKPGEVGVMVTDSIIGVAPGTYSKVALDLLKIKRQPPPADNNTADCFDTETKPNPLSFYPEYSYNACVRECQANHSIEKCGCRHFFEPAVGGADICNPQTFMSCILGKSNLTEFYEYLEDVCQCNSTCTEYNYKASTAITKYPNPMYVRDIYGDGIADTYQGYMEKNMMIAGIYFNSLSYDFLEEEIAYGVFDIIASLGGTLGVCIGASLLTICEFIQFGVNSIVWSLHRFRQKKRVSSTLIHIQPRNDFVRY